VQSSRPRSLEVIDHNAIPTLVHNPQVVPASGNDEANKRKNVPYAFPSVPCRLTLMIVLKRDISRACVDIQLSRGVASLLKSRSVHTKTPGRPGRCW
jgi:hypothetical protein